jgi:hypothetical protein
VKDTSTVEAVECGFPESTCTSFILSCGYAGAPIGSCAEGDWEELREKHGEKAFEVIGFTNDIETEDTFGRLRSGTLTLRGFLQRNFTYGKSYILRNKQNEAVGRVFPDFKEMDSTQLLYFPLGAHEHVAYCMMLRLKNQELTNTYVRVGVAGLEIKQLTWVSEEIVLV